MRAERLTNEQVNLLSDSLNTLIQQHTQLMSQLQNLWVALVVLSAIGILLIGFMVFAAAWSVRNVNNRTDIKMLEITGKFNLLIDILLEDARRKNDSGKSQPL